MTAISVNYCDVVFPAPAGMSRGTPLDAPRNRGTMQRDGAGFIHAPLAGHGARGPCSLMPPLISLQ